MGMFDSITPEQRGHLVAKMEQAAGDVLLEMRSVIILGARAYELCYGRGVATQYLDMTGDIVSILADLATQPHVIIT